VDADRSIVSSGSAQAPAARRRLGPLEVLILSAWCGLAGGLLEVWMRILCRAIDPTERMHMMSRHFVWLAPLSHLLLVSGVGLLLAIATALRPGRGGWLSARIIVTLAILPALMVISRQIYTAAWLILAMGIATPLAAALERHATGLRRRLIASFPALLGLVLVGAGSVFGGDWLKQRREAGRPLPPADSPNVLLIVLDTVRADHLSPYGYERPTTPMLQRLAQRGIRFDAARSTAPWTLPSHASLFTGRWPHELDVTWQTPLRGNFPTLAQYLGSHGYATAGFVANTNYCSSDTGLDRGFTHYEDYIFEKSSALRTAGLIDKGLRTFVQCVRDLNLDPSYALRISLHREFFAGTRKDAALINREFTRWLAQRPEPGRPFFVFLNYFEAHSPYLVPQGAPFRFGSRPRTRDEMLLLSHQWESLDKQKLARRYQVMVRDNYDNCLAYLDEQLGALFDELERRGVLDRTLVIITADHGEGLGEHGLFDHGESLYRPEIRVPLLILLPAPARLPGVVGETVSLRDLPATVVDLVALGSGAPFPGRSLARFWRASTRGPDPVEPEGALSELPSPKPSDPNQGRSPGHRGPLISLAEGDFVYIRNEGDGTEELFQERDDPRELTNRARVGSMQPVLAAFRRRLDRIKAQAP
jgi:arylsulfatase A-like enzyme